MEVIKKDSKYGDMTSLKGEKEKSIKTQLKVKISLIRTFFILIFIYFYFLSLFLVKLFNYLGAIF